MLDREAVLGVGFRILVMIPNFSFVSFLVCIWLRALTPCCFSSPREEAIRFLCCLSWDFRVLFLEGIWMGLGWGGAGIGWKSEIASSSIFR